jgi:hypothetical protein
VLGRRAMVSALRRPPLKSSRAEAGPTWRISVSATISCFTPASARDCKQHIKNFKSATPNKQWGPVVFRAASSYLLSACIDWDVSNTQPGEIGFCAQSALWPSRSSIRNLSFSQGRNVFRQCWALLMPKNNAMGMDVDEPN